MVENTLRLVKRILLLLPGIGIAYLAINDVYPLINRQLPSVLSILVTYVLFAYVLLPTAFRLISLISKPRHVPFYSTTPDGFASDPINVALFGTSQEVVNAMSAIGWQVADPRTPKNLVKFIVALLLAKPYPTAPFSSLYLLGRSQDLGFQLPVGGNPRHRHHVRFWAVKPTTAEHFREHVTFWKKHHPEQVPDDHFLWLGAASLDTKLGVIRHNGQISHMIHHDTNAERDLIVSLLKKYKLVSKIRTVTIASPYQLRNRVLTGYLQADGQLTICEL